MHVGTNRNMGGGGGEGGYNHIRLHYECFIL